MKLSDPEDVLDEALADLEITDAYAQTLLEQKLRLEAQLAAARAVIAAFVHLLALMTPQQKEAWAEWLEANK